MPLECTRKIITQYFDSEYSDSSMMVEDVRMPLCVVYDLENDRIRRRRVYFEMPALMAQLGVNS